MSEERHPHAQDPHAQDPHAQDPHAQDPQDQDPQDQDPDLARLVDRVPEGWTEVAYDGRRWGLSRADRARGATTSLYAEELGGPGVVSANVWRTGSGEVLRPCEMPAAVVVDFLRGWTRTDADEETASVR